MNILIVNDDGIDARGIHELCRILSQIKDARLYVVAPDRQRSAASHSMTMRSVLTLEKRSLSEFPGAAEVYACSGTPADCTKLGISMFAERGISIDMVCSGINHGANLGVDTYDSGTVGAAHEGSLSGVRGIAFSVNAREFERCEVYEDFIPRFVKICREKQPKDIVLNVNSKETEKAPIKGIKICESKGMRYIGIYAKREGEDLTFDVSAKIIADEEKSEGDVKYNNDGYMTISPLYAGMRLDDMLSELETWNVEY